MPKRTQPERHLTAFMKKEFGEHLGTLLLSGYKVSEARSRRAFTISLSDRVGTTEQHYLEMIAEGRAILPYGDDPLVLAALLKMLLGQGTSNRLVYCFPEVLRMLGWRDAIRGNRAVEGALVRYYSTSYAEVRRRRHPFVEVAVARTADQRIIAGYDLEDEPLRKYKEYSVIYTAVDFNPQFLDHLRRRSLFGIDWNLVTAVKAHI